MNEVRLLGLIFAGHPAVAVPFRFLAAATRNLQLIADDLKDLLQGMNSCSTNAEAEASARERTMKEALARTVQVLLQTRQNFKCKRLGELRADLSQLLAKMP